MYHPDNLYILQGKVLGGIIEINSEREREPASWFLARKSIRTILPYIISRICRPSPSSSSKRERREEKEELPSSGTSSAIAPSILQVRKPSNTRSSGPLTS
jgi:hypothetical protein